MIQQKPCHNLARSRNITDMHSYANNRSLANQSRPIILVILFLERLYSILVLPPIYLPWPPPPSRFEIHHASNDFARKVPANG